MKSTQCYRMTERVGEENTNYQGVGMRIVAYRNYKDIDVLFLNGHNEVVTTTYGWFLKGKVKSYTHIIGRKFPIYHRPNETAEVIDAIGHHTLVFRYADGSIREHARRESFKKEGIPNHLPKSYDLTDAKPINFKGLEHYYAKPNGEVFTAKGYKVNSRDRLDHYTYIVLNEIQPNGNITPKRYSLHRLIALTFVPNPNNYPCVNHIDGNRFNNDASNLEWVTYSQNNYHSIYVLGKQMGEKNTQAKFKDEDIPTIFLMHKEGMTIRAIAKKYNVRCGTISDILHGRTYTHITNKEYFARQRAKYLHM